MIKRLTFVLLSALIFPDNIIKNFPDFINSEIIYSNDNLSLLFQEYDNDSFCKAIMNFNHESILIKKILESQEEYTKTFDRISYLEKFKGDISHIVFDFPFPFTDREYIVKSKHYKKNDIDFYIYNATTDIEVSLNPQIIRLLDASGYWKVEPNGKNTILSYVWNGDLSGEIPDWTYKKIWIQQAKEIFENFQTSLSEF